MVKQSTEEIRKASKGSRVSPAKSQHYFEVNHWVKH